VRRGGGACGCDDACGTGCGSDDGCGAGCGTGYDTTGVLSYVGSGGAYIQETNFRYVGEGAGNFDVVPVPTNVRGNMCCCIIPLLLLLLFVPFLLYLLQGLSVDVPQTTTFPPTPMPEPITTFKPYVPPPTPAPPPPPTQAPRPPPPPPPRPSTTTPCPFDCNSGYNEWPMQWVKGWAGAKKLYCCKTVGRGCASELPPPSGLPPSGLPGEADAGPYDCNAGFHPCYHCLVLHWSPQKLKWCCVNMNKGCQSNTPA